MAFHIVTNNGLEFTWNIPETRPCPSGLGKKYRILELYADGHELESIISKFKNIPYRSGFTLWTGEMSQFIYDNL